MKDFPNVLLLGFGHRARSGKDSAANMIFDKLSNVHILHWADGVYEECSQGSLDFPLIKQVVKTDSKSWYELLIDSQLKKIQVVSSNDVPYLDKIFRERDISEYVTMQGKDAEILQFWGTDFRRKFYGMNYWVDRTMNKVKRLAIDNIQKNMVILIPDTRFKNEVQALRDNNGYYVKVVRLDEKGQIYIAKDRDPNHPSEAELEDYLSDYTLIATNLTELEKEVDTLLSKIKNRMGP